MLFWRESESKGIWHTSSIMSTFMYFWDSQQRHGIWRLWQLQYRTFYCWFVKIIISSCRIVAIWIVPFISVLWQMNAYKNGSSDTTTYCSAVFVKITVWGLLGAKILWVESTQWLVSSVVLGVLVGGFCLVGWFFMWLGSFSASKPCVSGSFW